MVDIKQATEAVNSIPEFMEAITKILQTPWGWGVLALIVGWFLINKDLSNIFNLLERGKTRRLEKLESYISNMDIAEASVLNVIKDQRDAYYFKVATGIHAENKLRKCLINLHNITSPKINWTLIRRALPYINAFSDMNISIREMNSWEKFGYYYNSFVGFMFLVFTGVIFIAFMLAEPKTLTNILFGAVSTLVCAIFSIFVFSQNWSHSSAKDIDQELKTIQLDDIENSSN